MGIIWSLVKEVSILSKKSLILLAKLKIKRHVVRRDDTKATINETHPSTAKIFPPFL